MENLSKVVLFRETTAAPAKVEDNRKWAVVFGCLGEGFSVTGPFDVYDDAEVYAEQFHHSTQYEIMRLDEPEFSATN